MNNCLGSKKNVNLLKLLYLLSYSYLFFFANYYIIIRARMISCLV